MASVAPDVNTYGPQYATFGQVACQLMLEVANVPVLIWKIGAGCSQNSY